ncbi:MAG: hypothetical protein EP343_33955 [Deltaproteobacteria bacterium]|nr:MAG: hypothetical protein EP343_33955 [Deltaproteobacteria bacterium]
MKQQNTDVGFGTRLKLLFLAGGGNLVSGMIVGFCLCALLLYQQAGYFPQGRDLLGYLVFGGFALVIVGISMRAWFRERSLPSQEKAPGAVLAPIFLVLALVGFGVGGYMATFPVPKDIKNQIEWDNKNCLHVMGAQAKTQQGTCRVSSRHCRNQIICERLSGAAQERNRKRWPKQLKRPKTTCQTARLLCVIDSLQAKGVSLSALKR